MATLTFPNIIPEVQNFGIKYNTQVSTTTLSGIVNTVELPGARWRGSISFRDMTPSESAELKAFLLQLRGASGRFTYGDLTHVSPFNNVSGTLTVESNSTPRSLRVTYDTGSELLSSGDYIQLGPNDDNRELKMVVDHTIVSGLTYDIIVEPMIRRTDYEGLTLTYSYPKGIFMLDTDDQAIWASQSKALLSDISLSFIEAFT